MGLTIVIFCITAILSPLAGISAFLIFYEEYSHHYPDKRKAFKIAFEAGIFTIVVFLVLGLLLAFLLPHCF